MKCPVCSCLLGAVNSEVGVLRVCPKCQGIWSQHGRLSDYAKKLSQSDHIKPEKFKPFEKRDAYGVQEIKEEQRLCPNCRVVMKKFNYAVDSNVFLDKCASCGGIWSDAGEAARIASYLKDDPDAAVVGQFIAKCEAEKNKYRDLGDRSLNRSLRQGYGLGIILPLNDDNPTQRFPFITISLIGICILIFAIQAVFGAWSEEFYLRFGFIPKDFFSIGLLTSTFLHVGVLHLAGNMFFLWLFGDNIEDRLGITGYILLFFACAFAADLLHALFNPGSSMPAVGASGAISGIMGAYLVFYPGVNIKVWVWHRIYDVPAWLYLGLWFLVQLFYGRISTHTDIGNVGWFAHIGGFVFGAAVAFVIKRKTNDQQSPA